MPNINDYGCDECGFAFRRGWGGYMYVIDSQGRRIPCPHPAEYETVNKVLGENASSELLMVLSPVYFFCLSFQLLFIYPYFSIKIIKLLMMRPEKLIPDLPNSLLDFAPGLCNEKTLLHIFNHDNKFFHRH